MCSMGMCVCVHSTVCGGVGGCGCVCAVWACVCVYTVLCVVV